MFVFLRSLIYSMELKCLNLRFLICLAKITNFLCILCSQFCLQYTKIQRFCKTWHSLNFNFMLIMKFNLENRIFYLFPNVVGFLKNVFKPTDQSTFKKEKLKGEHFEVAWTRKCAECGSIEKIRWLALHPSLSSISC